MGMSLIRGLISELTLAAVPLPQGGSYNVPPLWKKKNPLLVPPFFPGKDLATEPASLNRSFDPRDALPPRLAANIKLESSPMPSPAVATKNALTESFKTVRVSSPNERELQKAYYEISKSGTTDSRLWTFSDTKVAGDGSYFFDVVGRDDDHWLDPAHWVNLLPPTVTASSPMPGRSAYVTRDWQDRPDLEIASSLNVKPAILEIMAGTKSAQDVVQEIVLSSGIISLATDPSNTHDPADSDSSEDDDSNDKEKVKDKEEVA